MLKALAIILILWLPFSIGCLAAIFVSLWAIVFDKVEYGKNVLRAMDKVLASVCGFSGYYTLSAECGVAIRNPWIMLRWILNKMQPAHCEGAAIGENLKHNTGIWG